VKVRKILGKATRAVASVPNVEARVGAAVSAAPSPPALGVLGTLLAFNVVACACACEQ